jgi:hypothetical protein
MKRLWKTFLNFLSKFYSFIGVKPRSWRRILTVFPMVLVLTVTVWRYLSIDIPVPPVPVPLPVGPTAPPPPAEGEQEIEDLPKTERACTHEVEQFIREWSERNNFVVTRRYVTPTALDIEIEPLEVKQSNVATVTTAERMKKQQKLENCFKKFCPCPICNSSIPKKLTMSTENKNTISKTDIEFEIIHACPKCQGELRANRRHFNKCLHTLMKPDDRKQNNRNPDLRSENRLFSGISYLRITYSFRPRMEYSINTGTIDEHIITQNQRMMINGLRDQVKEAALCTTLQLKKRNLSMPTSPSKPELVDNRERKNTSRSRMDDPPNRADTSWNSSTSSQSSFEIPMKNYYWRSSAPPDLPPLMRRRLPPPTDPDLDDEIPYLLEKMKSFEQDSTEIRK